MTAIKLNGALNYVEFGAVIHPSGVSYGALNHVRFRAAMHLTWCMARPARLERATCGFVGKTSELLNLLKVKEVFDSIEFYIIILFLILASFCTVWKLSHTRSPT
jgi:hypothetical protein